MCFHLHDCGVAGAHAKHIVHSVRYAVEIWGMGKDEKLVTSCETV